MNRIRVITKKNVDLVAKFLENACERFKRDEDGCSRFALSESLAIYVGWSDGYDMTDSHIIKSLKGQKRIGDKMIGYAVNVAIKIRNDYDFSDFDYLDFPMNEEEDVWDNSTSIRPNETKQGYIALAEGLLSNFVDMVNQGYGR